jgi:cytochrome oxidase Cu insertion factor (SCO1/SenC/PrrC family)
MALLALAAGPAPAAEPLPLEIGGDFTLVDQNGQTRSSDEFRGRLTLVWFGYTECPHTCSMALASMSRALDELGKDADSIIPLFVTIDPEHDTPGRLAAHLAKFHPAFIGLTGPAADIARVEKAYRVAARRIDDSGAFERLFEHTTLIYLMSPDGELLSLLPATLPSDRIAEILRGYIRS